MKIKKLKLKNFRTYQNDTIIDFRNLTVFVGKNDIGKSTILEALDIFFNENKGIIKLEKDDINKINYEQGNTEVTISIVFEDLPEQLTIDATNPTTLSDEYLLNRDGNLEIIKKYPNAGNEKVFIKAYHPTNPSCSDLLSKKITELKRILDSNGIECEDRTKSAVIRSAIWNHFSNDLQFDDVEIDVTKEDAKNIWNQLKNYIPIYALFQSDRKNSDGDSEVQDPLKEAVKQILNNEELKRKFNEIATEVRGKLKEVADRTLDKLREMNPDVANSLNPIIPPVESLKWTDVFKKVRISGDEDIPINKRGSGIKRLILLNFFRAEAERRQQERNVPNIIYAIEEPETSQHPEHQRKLISAFKSLSNTNNTQIILTTHSPAIVKLLDFENIKLLKKENGEIHVIQVERQELPYPSLNEVNFLAFDESNEEYHNELYGYIEYIGKMNDYRSGKETIEYTRMNNGTRGNTSNITLTDYIRHQIHHPENTFNGRFTNEQLQQSIKMMREFIKENI